MNIKNYIYQDNRIKVCNSVNLSEKLDNLSRLPVYFDRVEGVFNISYNKINSLVGLPKDSLFIILHNNPLSFNSLFPLINIQKLTPISLPLELEKELIENDIYFESNSISIEIREDSIKQLISVLRNKILITNKEQFNILNNSFLNKKLLIKKLT